MSLLDEHANIADAHNASLDELRIASNAALESVAEWTRDDVYNHTVDDIVAAHNAALESAKQDFAKQIDAEQMSDPKASGETLALDAARQISKSWCAGKFRQDGGVVNGIAPIVLQAINAALAKVKEGK